ncbi:hypothetical protein SAMN05444673_6699 [Bacillus sp. OV166]|nr:hypothetical protein SAMN05444673_6699 [Bacillus sp. OV166]
MSFYSYVAACICVAIPEVDNINSDLEKGISNNRSGSFLLLIFSHGLRTLVACQGKHLTDSQNSENWSVRCEGERLALWSVS